MAADPQDPIALSSLRLPESGDLRRDIPAAPARRNPGYVASFDFHTLVYDCFYDAEARQVVLVCPRLLNLWPILRDGLELQGEKVGPTLRRRKYLRLEVLRIPAVSKPDSLDFVLGAQRFSVPVGGDDLAAFSGRNCLLTISKNNPIEWIEDWARYHIAAHGADALILFDNGSTSYTADELQARLSALPGLAVCRVLSAPFPYGGPGGGRLSVPAKFFQTAMFNIAQVRFLRQARAVLSVDIDELVWPMSGSVFDAAVTSTLGMVSFFGHWVYPAAPGTAQPQVAHSMRSGRKFITNPKWCLVPSKRAGRFSWAVHRPGGPFYHLTIRRRLGFWHCYACSTNWKKNRGKKIEPLHPCPDLIESLKTYLPGRV